MAQQVTPIQDGASVFGLSSIIGVSVTILDRIERSFRSCIPDYSRHNFDLFLCETVAQIEANKHGIDKSLEQFHSLSMQCYNKRELDIQTEIYKCENSKNDLCSTAVLIVPALGGLAVMNYQSITQQAESDATQEANFIGGVSLMCLGAIARLTGEETLGAVSLSTGACCVLKSFVSQQTINRVAQNASRATRSLLDATTTRIGNLRRRIFG